MLCSHVFLFLQGLRVTLYAKAMFSGGFFFHLSVYWWIDSPVNIQFGTNSLRHEKTTTKAKQLPANLQTAALRTCSTIKSKSKNTTKEKLFSRETKKKVREELKKNQNKSKKKRTTKNRTSRNIKELAKVNLCAGKHAYKKRCIRR